MRGTRTSLLVALSTFALGVTIAGTARAGALTIEFDGFMSSASIFGTLTAPPDGNLSPVGVRLTMPANGILSPIGGAATLYGFEIYADMNGNVATDALVSGSFFLQTNVSASAVLSPGAGALSLPSPLNLNASLFFDCSGAGCGALGLPVTTANGSLLLAPSSIGITNFSSLGSAEIIMPFTFTFGGVPVTINFVGLEVMRTFVPEPGTGTLLSYGLLTALALCTRLRRSHLPTVGERVAPAK